MKRCVIIVLLSLNAICICSQSLEIDSTSPSITTEEADENKDLYRQFSPRNYPDVDSASTVIEQSLSDFPDSLAWLKLVQAKASLLAKAHRHDELSTVIAPAIQFAERRRMNVALVHLYDLIAVGETYRGEYGEALRSYHRIIPLMFQDSVKKNRPDVFNNIGMLYLKIRDVETAMHYFRKANEIAPNPGTSLNIALAYAELDSQEQTLIYIKNAEALVSRPSPQFQDAMMLHFVYGKLFLNQDTDSAETRFYKSLLLAKLEGDRRMEAENLVNLARCHMRKRDFAKAMQALGAAEFVAEENDFNEILLAVYRQFIQLLRTTGQEVELAHYQSQFIAKKEALYNAELSRELALAESRVLERRNKEILAHQEEELSVQSGIMGYQQWMTFVGIGVALLTLLVFGSFLFDFYDRYMVTYSLKKKVNERIRLLHDEKNRANEIMHQREGKLKEVRLRTLETISKAQVSSDESKVELEVYLHAVKTKLLGIGIRHEITKAESIEYIDHDQVDS